MIGTPEIILIVLVVILLFGATKLPELARSLGKSAGEFKKAQKESERELNEMKTSINTEAKNTSKIHEIAKEMHIDTKGKTDDEILEEIERITKAR